MPYNGRSGQVLVNCRREHDCSLPATYSRARSCNARRAVLSEVSSGGESATNTTGVDWVLVCDCLNPLFGEDSYQVRADRSETTVLRPLVCVHACENVHKAQSRFFSSVAWRICACLSPNPSGAQVGLCVCSPFSNSLSLHAHIQLLLHAPCYAGLLITPTDANFLFKPEYSRPDAHPRPPGTCQWLEFPSR